MYVEDISLDAIWIKTRWSRGGVIENIVYRDLMTTGTGSTAVLISITYSSSDNNPAGEKTGGTTGVGAPPLIRNLTFENIVAWGTSGNNGFAFQGLAAGSATVDGVRWSYPVSRIQNVVIRNSSSSRSNSSLNYVDGFTSYNVKVANTSGLFSSSNSLNVIQNAREVSFETAVQGGGLRVTLYNSPVETIRGTAVVAFYNPDGRLASAAPRSFGVEPNGNVVFTEPIPEAYAGYDYQVFAWDEAYVPLCDAAAGSLPA
jgi:hypothetical protein